MGGWRGVVGGVVGAVCVGVGGWFRDKWVRGCGVRVVATAPRGAASYAARGGRLWASALVRAHPDCSTNTRSPRHRRRTHRRRRTRQSSTSPRTDSPRPRPHKWVPQWMPQAWRARQQGGAFPGKPSWCGTCAVGVGCVEARDGGGWPERVWAGWWSAWVGGAHTRTRLRAGSSARSPVGLGGDAKLCYSHACERQVLGSEIQGN